MFMRTLPFHKVLETKSNQKEYLKLSFLGKTDEFCWYLIEKGGPSVNSLGLMHICISQMNGHRFYSSGNDRYIQRCIDTLDTSKWHLLKNISEPFQATIIIFFTKYEIRICVEISLSHFIGVWNVFDSVKFGIFILMECVTDALYQC